MIWRDLSHLYRKTRGKKLFALDADSVQSLHLMAKDEGVHPTEIMARLVRSAVQERTQEAYIRERWNTLTPREKQVTALICRELTSRQAASILKIAPTTVKTHVENVLRKFGVSNRESLRQMLSGWDLSSFE